MFHTIKNENPGVKSQFHSYLMPVKSQPKVVEYNLEASVFNREIAPGKTIEAWGSVQSEFKI